MTKHPIDEVDRVIRLDERLWRKLGKLMRKVMQQVPPGVEIKIEMGEEPVYYDGGAIYASRLFLIASHDSWKLVDEDENQLSHYMLYTISIAYLVNTVEHMLKNGYIKEVVEEKVEELKQLSTA